MRWTALGLAAFLNLLLLLVGLWSWTVAPDLTPPPIPVELVMELPPPPAPPTAKPPPPPVVIPKPQETQPLFGRESGPGERTTRAVDQPPPEPSPVEEVKVAPQIEAPAPVVQPQPPVPKPTLAPSPEIAKPTPPPQKPAVATPRPTPAAPRNVVPNAEIGDSNQTGDPYLNQLDKIFRNHVVYPARAGVLNLKGYVIHRLGIDNHGRLLSIELVKSSGVAILDKAARDAIMASLPFPAPPPGYPAVFGVEVGIPLEPN